MSDTPQEQNAAYPRATVREVGGQLVLDDPAAVAFVRAVSKHNCRGMLDLNADRVAHFKSRIAALGRSASDTIIVLLNVDTELGATVAEILMPNHDWDAIRARGEVPVARGLINRDGAMAMLGEIDREAEAKLRAMSEIAVMVVDHDVVEIFPAGQI